MCIIQQEQVTDNSRIRIYVNKIENRIILKINRGYYLQILVPETIKLLGNTKKKRYTKIEMVKICLI